MAGEKGRTGQLTRSRTISSYLNIPSLPFTWGREGSSKSPEIKDPGSKSLLHAWHPEPSGQRPASMPARISPDPPGSKQVCQTAQDQAARGREAGEGWRKKAAGPQKSFGH